MYKYMIVKLITYFGIVSTYRVVYKIENTNTIIRVQFLKLKL